jgi:hypothetical protein
MTAATTKKRTVEILLAFLFALLCIFPQSEKNAVLWIPVVSQGVVCFHSVGQGIQVKFLCFFEAVHELYV